MRRWLCAAAVGWVAPLLLSSCSSSALPVTPAEARCRRICEAGKACLPPEEARRVDCYTSCDDLKGVNRENDCADEVDDYYDCVERVGACGDVDTECAAEQEVYSSCIADPCSVDPDRDICL
jgi:hypothetical protein